VDDKERYAIGAKRRRQVIGNEWVDRAEASITPFNADFQEFVTRYAWGELWMRPQFDDRTRRILVIGTLIALNKMEEFRLHVRVGLTEGGLSPEDIREVIMQQAIYVGVPAANHAFREATAIVNEVTKNKSG
jgi:4-carboxymuconolactone decarboxylase